MKGPFKIMLCGVIGLSIIWFFINLISSIFTNIFVTKNVDNSSVNKFIIESRCKWIKTQKDFYDGKKKIYVARQAEVNEFEILKREISIMKTDQKMISKIDISGISEDSSIRESNKIMNYINNAINELILALKPSIEGETTMQYIRKILVDSGIKISKIATGVPIGTEMEYIDSLTLEMAIDERKNMN